MSVPQSTVSQFPGYGVPGTKFDDSPFRALSYTLLSASAAYNIIGATAFTVIGGQQGKAQAGNGAQPFAGILVNPEMFASFGATGGSPLSPTLTLANYAIAPLCTMGRIYVTLPAAADIGDLVVFNDTTGALSTVAPGDALPVGTTFAQAQVIEFDVSGAGLAVIEVSPYLVAPT